MDIIRKIISQNIVKRRKELGLTQAELAKNAGLSEITVNRYETGKQPPRSLNLEAIAKALGSTVEELTQQHSPPAASLQTDLTRAAAFLSKVESLSLIRKKLIFALVYSDPAYIREYPRLIRPFLSLLQSTNKAP